MKLSALVDYLNQLEQLSVQDVHRLGADQLWQLGQILNHHDVIRFEEFIIKIEQDIDNINKSFYQLQSDIDSVKDHVRNEIRRLQPFYFARSLAQFMMTGAIRNPQGLHEQLALSRNSTISDDIKHRIAASIGRTQNWCWPGMIVSPGLETFIDGMTAMDPLYLVDTDLQLLKPALERFNELYQRRLACYRIEENLGKPILSNLPQGQMGLCLLYFYLNFRPMEIIRKWLDELWSLLRPGGRVLMTYNDCDRAHGVRQYESGYMSYTPGHLIREYAANLGFEIVEDWHPTDDVSWLELRRPGELRSLRATQTLAKIVARSK